MKYSASQAAKAVGKTVPTITRAINSGKISAERTESGGYLIEPVELHRVFPPVTANTNATPAMLQIETPNDMRVLQAEIEGLRERLTDKDDTIADLRRRLDAESEERRRYTAMLTDQRSPPEPEPAEFPPTEAVEPPKRRWWPWSKAND